MQLLSHAAILLDEVARSGSIRRAAERLNLSASAVNRQILNLEEETGMPLFERLPRGVRLTAAGETLVAEIRRWRREHERAEERLLELRGLRRGRIAIGVMECLTAGLVPHAIATLQRRSPRVAVDVFVGGTDAVLERITAKTIDMALCFNAPKRDMFRTLRSVATVPGLAMSADHPLAGRASLRLTDCVPYSFVLPDRSIGLRRVIDSSFARSKLEPATVVTTNSIGLMKTLVADGLHLAVLNRLDVLPELASGRFVLIPMEDARMVAEELSLIVGRDRHLSTAAEIMAQIFETALDGLDLNVPSPAGPQ
jgi:DNA-binding transcriptional LysR family regulator